MILHGSMMADEPIECPRAPLDRVLSAPPSKSVTHRALVVAALASGASEILDPLRAEDSRATLGALQALGIEVDEFAAHFAVRGCAGEVPGGGTIDAGESGTTARFALALAALGARASRIDGAPRLRKRPFTDLANSLHALGARVEMSTGGAELPAVAGGAPLSGGRVRIESGRSSQFASALLLIGPRLPGGLDLCLVPPVVSLPYVELTVEVMRSFGVEVERVEPLRFRVAEGAYPGRRYRVEGDHSSASYFLAAAAIAGGRVRVEGLDPASAQPDSSLGPLLRRMGCEVEHGELWIEVRGADRLRGIDVDLTDSPDIVPTVAVVAMFADRPSVLRGIGHLRDKESDRLLMLAENLNRLGCTARAGPDRIEIEPGGSLRGTSIRTASDHRMAMAFALAALRLEGVSVDDPNCVSKSNPDFWRQFASL